MSPRTEKIPADLEPLPPSCKLVYLVLDRQGPLTQADLCNYAALSQRTAYDAIEQLQEVDAIERQPHHDDNRFDLYDVE